MRILVHYLIAIAALLSCVVDYAKSFPSQWVSCSRRTHVRGNGRNALVSGSPRLVSLNDDNDNDCLDDEGESSTKWTMEEDWALVDNLPLFTVSTGAETKTFWTQLWSANPLLFSTKQTEDLHRRTLELQQKRGTSTSSIEQQTIKKSNSSNSNGDGSQGSRSSLVFGDSPPVLENWKIDPEQQDNRVVGQVGSGKTGGRRTIWFHYHSIGRLEGDPFVGKYDSSSAVCLFPGGYIEAVGGRIYELGQPMLLEEWGKKDDASKIIGSTDAGFGRGDDNSSSRWWLPGSTAAISALVSSTILSACIGYGAGLSIIQDQPSQYRANTQQPTPTMVTVGNSGVKMLPQSSSSTVAAATKSFTIKSAPDLSSKPSTEEIRANAQYRVLREERLLKKITQRLEIDKQNLKQLDADQQSSGLRP